MNYEEKYKHELKSYRASVTQETQKTADKVEPKFKVDDWIVFNGLILHIDEVINGYYRTTSIGYGIHNSYDWDIDNIASLWTIQDAKDGDVLCYETKDDFIIFIYKNGHIHYHCCYSNGHLTTIDSFFVVPKYLLCYIHPATKEQRYILFAKMKEAGYEWDGEKKELKKIESKMLDPDKVIEWIDDQACQGWIEDIEVDKFVDKFKKDFGL